MKITARFLTVKGAPKRIVVDPKMLKTLQKYSWCWVPRIRRAQAIVQKGKPRQLLHRFIARRCGYKWQEVFFDNGNEFDCRKVNLRPYRRDVEGARRKRYKNNKSGRKGVYFHKPSNKWAAVIRAHHKLKHLGYFPNPTAAGNAYAEAFRQAHPELQ